MPCTGCWRSSPIRPDRDPLNNSMRYTRLDDWLAWLETLHPSTIELGLDRVRAVAERLGLLSVSARPTSILTIAGTNGKGSVVALLEALLSAHNKHVGCYTSPHILRFNERIRIDGTEIADSALLHALAAVDAARHDISLTYFEFTTLAALLLFRDAHLDVWVLEVGLGGRLDAVNVIDPDVAVLTSVGLDHQAWLGNTREAIGYEKAGIFRSGRPAVVGDPLPPASVRAAIAALGAQSLFIGQDFFCVLHEADNGDAAHQLRAHAHAQNKAHWSWRGQYRGNELALNDLPLPSLALTNAATALQAFCRLPFALDTGAARTALSQVRLSARNQHLRVSDRDLIIDVGHNADALRFLSAELPRHGLGMRFHVVFAMLDDKDIEAAAHVLEPLGQSWHIAPLPGPRSATVARLHAALSGAGATNIRTHADIATALRAALAQTDTMPVLATGSFYTVGAVLQALDQQSLAGC